jgi:hypothetical protein
MKSAFALGVSIALLLPIATARVTAGKIKAVASTTAPSQKVPASGPARGGEFAALERKLLGAWKGPACAGDYTFNADGTYECRNFTPGQNTLAGTWSIRWDALPPTLLLACTTSDFKKKDPSREDFAGKTVELRLVELNSDAFAYRYPNDKFEWRNSRPDEKQDSGEEP